MPDPTAPRGTLARRLLAFLAVLASGLDPGLRRALRGAWSFFGPWVIRDASRADNLTAPNGQHVVAFSVHRPKIKILQDHVASVAARDEIVGAMPATLARGYDVINGIGWPVTVGTCPIGRTQHPKAHATVRMPATSIGSYAPHGGHPSGLRAPYAAQGMVNVLRHGSAWPARLRGARRRGWGYAHMSDSSGLAQAGAGGRVRGGARTQGCKQQIFLILGVSHVSQLAFETWFCEPSRAYVI